MSDLREGEILCVGNALLDVSFFIESANFLEENGLKANDAILLEKDRYEKLKASLESQFKTQDCVPGGAAQNTARTTAWLMSPLKKGVVTYMGSIANDKTAEILKDKAVQAGVNGIYELQDDGTPTGCCLVIVWGPHRSLAAYLGAAVKFSDDHVVRNWGMVEKAKYCYIEGFFLSTCLDACMRIAKHMSEMEGKMFMLNLSAEFVTTFHKDMLLKIMPYVDVLFGNDAEFHSLAKELGLGTDLEKIAMHVATIDKHRSDPPRIVVVTCGPDPVIIAKGFHHSAHGVEKVQVAPLSKEQLIDSNGAGDAFCGGFIASHLRGKSLQDCAKVGSKMAQIVIQRLGCTFPDEVPCIDDMAN